MKVLATLLALSFAIEFGLAQSQPAVEPSYIGATATYGPNILVPRSNVRTSGDRRNLRFTQYLVNAGPWLHSSIDQACSSEYPTFGPSPLVAPIPGYHPADLQTAYGLTSTGGQNAIAIVDAHSDHYLQSDFNKFCSTFGLPQETSSDVTAASNQHLQVVYADGTVPSEDANWAGEISLDAEWAHSLAPAAKIYVVEATDATAAALARAVQVASKLPGVREVSMSYGSDSETSNEQTEDPIYTQSGVVYYGASGDRAGVRGYPSMSPNVVCVGGTSLKLKSGAVTGLSVWVDAGAGGSVVVPRPAYQDSVASVVGQFRGTPDISADADPNTGVAIYDSFAGGWIIVGGTSLACPLSAAIANVRGNFSASSPAELTRLYSEKGTSLVRDVTTGSIKTIDPNTNLPTGEVLTAGVGYDLASGLGETVGLFSAVTSSTGTASAVQNLYGVSFGSSLASLNAVDGNSYVLISRSKSGVGQVASLDVVYPITLAAGQILSSAQVAVSASALSGAVNNIYALNAGTGLYDLIGSYSIAATQISGTFFLDISKYVSSTNSVNLRFQAVRGLKYGYSGFAFRVDQAVLQLKSTNGP